MATQTDRRDFLAAGLSIASSILLEEHLARPCAAAQPPSGFVRYSVFDARAKLDSYERGVAQMKKWSDANADDKRGWTFQASIHGSMAAGDFFNKCEHASWWFVPWHRAYLYFFERILRQASGDPNFTLPYWDWNIAGRRALPDAFQNNTSTLYDDTRLDAINAGEPLLAREIDPSNALAAPLFLGLSSDPGFGGVSLPGRVKGLLERPPHDTVHVLISGNMGDPRTAALDPIFWLHHANVDRLWDVWLAGGHLNPSDDAWMKNVVDGTPQPFTFFDENGQKVDVTSAEFLPGGSRLDYQYDNLQGNSRMLLTNAGLRKSLADRMKAVIPPPDAALTEEQKKAISEKRKKVFGDAKSITVTSADNRVVLGASPVTVQAVIAEDKRQTLKTALELVREDLTSRPVVILHIEDVQSTAPPGVVFRVFLNRRDADASTDPDEANYVGSIALFQSSGHGIGAKNAHKSHPGETFSFDVTHLLQIPKEQKKLNEGKLDVTLVSKGVGSKNQPRAEVSFKKVSITVERR
jgi:tyrosinase